MVEKFDKLEYIASGTSYLRIIAPRNQEPDAIEIMRDAFKQVEVNTNHEFGLLFNAFTESRFGKSTNHYRDILRSVHSDSGGLQMITQGKIATDDMKRKIFAVQGEYSDYAMSFDESPVKTTGLTSTRTSTSDRYFDSDHFDLAAKLTGQNVRKQIEAFIEMKSATKPIFIAQGNCYDTYMRWTDLAMSQIPNELKPYITSVALGASAIGYGFLEDIERAVYFKYLPIENVDHLHVLGVGALRRLFPYLIMKQNGMYPEGVRISYDSTTHTSGVEMGQYFFGKKTIKFNRKMSKDYHTMINDMNSMFDFDIGVDEFFKAMNNGYTSYVEKGGDDVTFLKAKTYMVMKSIINFCRYIDSVYTSKDKMLEAADGMGLFKEVYSLYSVQDKDTFDMWLKDAKGSTRSKRVSADIGCSLEDLF